MFELASGLKINFHKSSLMGVNVPECWLNAAAEILNCRIGIMPFKYLGLPVGALTGRKQTWNPLIKKVRGRLAAWKGKLLSLGGRLTLINSVLSCIMVFFMSMCCIPDGVIQVLD
ncbi:hypothetical protein Ancab_040347 [Ancistrocladus abbreviatus]